MKPIFFFASLLVLPLLSACSGSGQADEPFAGDPTIRARSYIADGRTTVSRGLVTGTDVALSAVSFLRVDAAAGSTPSDFSSATLTTGGSRSLGGAVSFGGDTPPLYDIVDDHHAWFRGFTPVATTPVPGTYAWVMDGATDVLLTDLWDAGRYSLPATTPMVFRHLPARLEIICKADPAAALSAVQSVWGNIESISLSDAYPEIHYTAATNQVTSAGVRSPQALLNGTSYTAGAFTPVAIPASDSEVVTASALIAPIASRTIKLQIKAGGKAQSKEIEVNNLSENLDAGRIHKVTLTFRIDGKSIEATGSSVTDWSNGGSGSGDIGE